MYNPQTEFLARDMDWVEAEEQADTQLQDDEMIVVDGIAHQYHIDNDNDCGVNADIDININDDEYGANAEYCPCIEPGMEFNSSEEAWVTYLAYSKVKGFGIRKDSNFKSRSNPKITIGRSFVCDKEGKSKGKELANTHKRDTRTGCKARMRINLNQQTNVWRVGTFDDNHNHELLSPSEAINFRSHKKFHRSSIMVNAIDFLHAKGISNLNITKMMNVAAGSEECTLTSQQTHDRVDANCVLRSVFWADGRSRKAYMEFSDVISFDVTYRTNRFNMPFAPFTGVNHHRQSTLFGCALLADETEETFVWLFEEWLKCMFGRAPGAIITDQDGAICAAIGKVFPNTRHRYCSWHLHKHAVENLGLFHPSNIEFANDYRVWLESDSIVESETRWELLKHKYSGEKITWLSRMYDKRKHWVPAYLKDVFTAGMRSTQRSESINAFFDGYVNSMTPLSEFITQYDKALKARRKAEKNEDFVTMSSKARCQSEVQFEQQVAARYTRKIFDIFQTEFYSSHSYYKHKVRKDDLKTEYLVGKQGTDKSNWRIVIFEVSSDVTLTCSCAKFETEGILCRHLLAILRLKQIPIIPEKYILRRWTIDARHQVIGHSSIITDSLSSAESVTPVMLLLLQGKHQKFLKEVALSTSLYKMYDSWLDTQLYILSQKKLSIDRSESQSSQLDVGSRQCPTEGIEMLTDHIKVYDPCRLVKTKGRPRESSRRKSGAELSQEEKHKEARQNSCKQCGVKGHNRTTCKANIN